MERMKLGCRVWGMYSLGNLGMYGLGQNPLIFPVITPRVNIWKMDTYHTVINFFRFKLSRKLYMIPSNEPVRAETALCGGIGVGKEQA